MAEIGRWYRWAGQPPGFVGRPVRIFEDHGGLYKGRWADGLECTLFAPNIGEPIPDDEAPIPGVTEPCMVCNGGMIPVHEATDEGWVSVVVGARPCPNCR